MIIKKYGLELVRLRSTDIELVRMHRNSLHIKQAMFFQEDISRKQQKEWFLTINNSNNYYFIIHTKGRPVGLIHGKVESFESGIAEGGIFIWDDEGVGTHIPLLASVCMADFTFLLLQLTTTKAEVRADNSTAIAYNKALGYKVVNEDKDEGKLQMELSRDSYLNEANQLRTMVRRVGKDDAELSWDDISFPKQYDASLYDDLPDQLKEQALFGLSKEVE